MNKTNYATNGGLGEVLDDLTFDQQAVRDAFYGLLSAFGVSIADSFIISGCNLVAGVYQPGYIALGGEILKFDGAAQTSLPGGNTRVWDVLATFDSNGDRILESGGAFQAYQVRKAQVTYVLNANAPNYLAVSGAPTIQDKIVAMIASEDWVVIDADCFCRKDAAGFVHLIGIVGVLSNTVTLPVGNRPASNQTFKVLATDNNGDSSNTVQEALTISTAGVIASTYLSGAGTQRMIDLKGISFKAA